MRRSGTTRAARGGQVSYELDPTIDYPRQFVGHVAIGMHDGRVIEERQDHPRGGPDFPMTREELETKFRGNAALAVPAEQVERAIRSVDGLAAPAGRSSPSWSRADRRLERPR